MDLVTFLRDRLDEDDRAARISPRDDAGDPEVVAQWSGKSASNLYVQFYAHFDPARVLREVEAKRRLLAYVEDNPLTVDWWFRVEDDFLRLLAMPYDSHPDYREEWKP